MTVEAPGLRCAAIRRCIVTDESFYSDYPPVVVLTRPPKSRLFTAAGTVRSVTRIAFTTDRDRVSEKVEKR
jgi:hypothetical protein